MGSFAIPFPLPFRATRATASISVFQRWVRFAIFYFATRFSRPRDAIGHDRRADFSSNRFGEGRKRRFPIPFPTLDLGHWILDSPDRSDLWLPTSCLCLSPPPSVPSLLSRLSSPVSFHWKP